MDTQENGSGFFSFDLQRFSEDESDQTQSGNPPSGAEETETNTAAEPQFALRDGKLAWAEAGEGENADISTQTPEDTEGQEQQQPPTYYTAEQIRQLGLENLNQEQLPPELRPFYQSLQADYAQKKDQLQQRQLAMDEILQQAQQNHGVQPTNIQDQPNKPTEFVELVTQMATDSVKKLYGTEEYDDFDPRQRAAFHIELNRLITEANSYHVQEQQKKEQRQQVAEKLIPLFQEFQREPNFNEMDKLAETYYQTLPYKDALQIAQVIERLQKQEITLEDIPVLQKYYHDVKVAYTAGKTGISTAIYPAKQPPKVESSGQGTESQPTKPPDVSQLSGMTQEQRIEFYKRHHII
jgi:hypothetical protein